MMSSGLRYLTLWLARGLGAVCDLLRKPVALNLLLLLVVAGTLATADRMSRLSLSGLRGALVARPGGESSQGPVDAKAPAAPVKPSPPPTGGTQQPVPAAGRVWLTPWNVISVWAFGLLTWSVVRARRRLVVTRFEDFTDKRAGLDVAGFGVLVAAQLSSLNELFRQFEPGSAIQATPERLTPLNATFEADSAGPELEKAVSSEASFTLGPLRLPVGFVMGLVGRLVQGPRVTGQIHRDGSCRIVTARLAGRLGERSWRIVDSNLGAETGKETWRSAAELADELASNVFAELVIGPTVRWKAITSFAAGVRAYRESLQFPRDRRANLKAAEQCLVRALAEDPRFDLAYYNLGVVYTELEKPDAAGAAFDRALKENGRRWSTHYALAVTNHGRAMRALNEGRNDTGLLYLSKTLDHCEQARRHAPEIGSVAQVLSVNAVVLWWRAFRMWSDRPEAQRRELEQAGRIARRAVVSAWRALVSAEVGLGIQSRELPAVRGRARTLAVRSLRDLASMQLEWITLLEGLGRGAPAARMLRWFLARSATRLLSQARALAPWDAQICVELGVSYLRRGKWRASAACLRDASRIDPDSSEVWGLLALALARLDARDAAHEAEERLFEGAHRASHRSIQALVEASHVQAELADEVTALASRPKTAAGSRSRWRVVAGVTARFLRLAHRLGERRLSGLGHGTTLLKTLLADEESRAKFKEPFEMTAIRAEALATLRERVAAVHAKQEDDIEPLKTLYQEARGAGRAWEAAEVGQALAQLYRNLDRPKQAQESLQDLIPWLEGSLDGEVKRRGLRVLLSRALRQQGMLHEALAEATKAIELDPLSAFERIELGWTHFELAEHAAAQAAWEQALLLEPGQPALSVNLGRTYLQRLGEAKGHAERAATLDAARHHLETALDLYDRDDPHRCDAQYLLASVHSYAGRPVDALRELQVLEQSDYCRLIVRLTIADTHFTREEWTEAAERFRTLATDIDGQMKTDGANAVLPAPPGESAVLGTASAYAHLGIAGSLAERGILLSDALEEVGRARASLKNVTHAGLVSQWTATCDYYEGLILLKQDQVDAAIAKLEAALVLNVTAETYFVLAQALARRVEIAGKGLGQAPTLRRAFAYCGEATRLDWKQELSKRIPDVVSQLESLRKP